RRNVRERRAGAASREQHDAVARAFAAAAATGEVSALIALLDPDVVLRSVGGGKVSADRKPPVGAGRVARFLLGLPNLTPGLVMEATIMPDGVAFLNSVD